MASSSDNYPSLPHLPDFSQHQHHNLFSTAGDMKFHLQSLLDNKEKQLQQAATLGQRVLAQQMELDERIRQLQELEGEKDIDTEDDNVDDLVRDRYRELADTLAAWDRENAQLSSAFSSLKRFPNGKPTSPSIKFAELPREEPERTRASVGTSAAQSRRAKNAAHRADDVEFAFEIGSGLLTEVRRLQSLLGERDKAIQDMKEEKDDLEKSVESLRAALRQQEQSTDKYKEENWNLEVNLQELRTQLTDSQSATLRLESENKRLTKLLSGARDAGDQHKNESERLANAVEEMKIKHETDIAQARRHAAGLVREKSDLQQAVDTLKKEVARAGRRLPRFGSPLTPNGGYDSSYATTPANAEDGASDVFTGGASTNRRKGDASAAFAVSDDMDDYLNTPDVSPVRQPFLSPNHPKNEIEALQQRLAHAQRQINTLKGSLQREKQLKMEYRSKLEASPGAPKHGLDDEEEVEDADADDTLDGKPKTRVVTPLRSGGRGRGRGRGRGGMTLMQRFEEVSPATVYDEDSGEWPSSDHDDTPPVPPIPIQLSQADEKDQDESDHAELVEDQQRPSDGSRSPSPSGLEPPSNRTSVDGMDPAFANVLKRRSSNGSTKSGSPFRLSVFSSARQRGGRAALGIGRRPRGGVPYKEARPPSLVGAPDVLSAELLGMEGSPLKNTELLEEIEEVALARGEEVTVTAEVGCQTESMEERVMEEVGIQCDVEGGVTFANADQGIQTDKEEESVPLYAESSAGTDPEPEPELIATPVLVQAQTQTLLTEKADADTQTVPEPIELGGEFRHRRTTITQRDGLFAGDVTLRGEDEDGNETEIGPETETEMEDYHDASQSIGAASLHASESRDDFHSIMTVTDNDFSESEEEEGTLGSERNVSMVSSIDEKDPVEYEDVGVSADFRPEPERVVERIEVPAQLPPKPELKDISIQTEEWNPPVPTVAPSPVHPAALTPGLYRVGSTASNHSFQFVAPPTSTNANVSNTLPLSSAAVPFAAAPGPVTSLLKESGGTFPRMKHASSPDRRQSMESALSSLAADQERNRPRVQSTATATMLSSLDKTKPPMMLLPPPPKAPPPPSSMPPPSFIPDRRIPGGPDGPPPRPSSPPPPELIQRATTPTFGTALAVPGVKGAFAYRQAGASMPPSQAGLRQPPSTSSFRSAANAAAHAAQFPTISAREKERREFSQSSLVSERSVASPRSSISSEHHHGGYRVPIVSDPTTPNKSAGTARPMSMTGGMATDPAIIHAITQTMIGEFMYKYTRRTIGKGHGERRHRRFFWVHPYTKTLYWSSADPGSTNVSESSAKSAYIEDVRSVLDPNPMPPGLHQYSVVVSTPQREMKITAPTKERHDIWLNALKYLLARPNALTAAAPNSAPQSSPTSQDFTDDEHLRGAGMSTTPQSHRSVRSGQNRENWNHTPRGQRSRSQLSMRGSIKRSNTPAAEYLKWNGMDSPYSPTKSFVDVSPPRPQDDEDLDFELHRASMSDGYEGLENVRACCDGRHTVGRSGQPNHHHHHHHHHHNHNHTQKEGEQQVASVNRDPVTRPTSPAWSFRSRTGSTHSNDGGPMSIFSWGRAEGKLRFGSKRSARTVPTSTD